MRIEERILQPDKNPLIRILSRDPALGGVLVLIQGKPGSGKTSLLLYLATKEIWGSGKTMIEHDITVWRGMYSCQFQRFPIKDKILLHFLEHDFHNTIFYNTKTGQKVDIEHFYPVVLSRSMADLYLKLKLSKGYFNVLFLYRTDWYDFLDYLVYFRPDMEWISLLFDEFQDIAPAYPNKYEFKKLLKLEPITREVRKQRISLYVNVHMNTDLYYLIKEKFQYHIYLPGAKRLKYSSVYQKAINALEAGKAIVDDLTNYMWLEFPEINYETNLKMVNYQWHERMKQEIEKAARLEFQQKNKDNKKRKKKRTAPPKIKYP